MAILGTMRLQLGTKSVGWDCFPKDVIIHNREKADQYEKEDDLLTGVPSEATVLGTIQLLCALTIASFGGILVSASYSSYFNPEVSTTLLSGYLFIGFFCFAIAGILSIALSNLASNVASSVVAVIGLFLFTYCLTALGTAFPHCNSEKKFLSLLSYLKSHHWKNEDKNCHLAYVSAISALGIMLLFIVLEVFLAVYSSIFWWKQVYSNKPGGPSEEKRRNHVITIDPEETVLTAYPYRPHSSLLEFLKGEPKLLGAIQILLSLVILGFGIILALNFIFSTKKIPLVVLTGYPFWGAVIFFLTGFVTMFHDKPRQILKQDVTTMNILSLVAALAGIALILLSFTQQHKFCQAPSLEGPCVVGRTLLLGNFVSLINHHHSRVQHLCDYCILKKQMLDQFKREGPKNTEHPAPEENNTLQFEFQEKPSKDNRTSSIKSVFLGGYAFFRLRVSRNPSAPQTIPQKSDKGTSSMHVPEEQEAIPPLSPEQETKLYALPPPLSPHSSESTPSQKDSRTDHLNDEDLSSIIHQTSDMQSNLLDYENASVKNLKTPSSHNFLHFSPDNLSSQSLMASLSTQVLQSKQPSFHISQSYDLISEDFLSENIPFQDNQSQDTPSQYTPSQDIQFQDILDQEISFQEIQFQETPYQDTLAQDILSQETPSQETPYQGTPYQELSYQDILTKDISPQETHYQYILTKEIPFQATPLQENLFKGTPSQGTPSQGTPSQGTPSQRSPSKGTPSQGTPSQGTPSQGTPSQWTLSKGTPSQGTSPKGTPSQGSPFQVTPPKGTPSQGTPPKGTPSQGTLSQGTPSEATPYQETPPEGTPYQRTPSEATPSKGTPSEGTPYQGTPSQGTPPQGTPSQGTPSEGTPYQGTPSQGTPPQGTPSEGTPYQGTPSQGTPPQGTPSQGTPSQGTPPQGTPSARDSTPRDSLSFQDILTKDTSSQETPYQETPFQDSLTQNAPSQDTQYEETPLQEIILQDTPFQSTPSQNTQYQDIISQEKLSQSSQTQNTVPQDMPFSDLQVQIQQYPEVFYRDIRTEVMELTQEWKSNQGKKPTRRLSLSLPGKHGQFHAKRYSVDLQVKTEKPRRYSEDLQSKTTRRKSIDQQIKAWISPKKNTTGKQDAFTQTTEQFPHQQAEDQQAEDQQVDDQQAKEEVPVQQSQDEQTKDQKSVEEIVPDEHLSERKDEDKQSDKEQPPEEQAEVQPAEDQHPKEQKAPKTQLQNWQGGQQVLVKRAPMKLCDSWESQSFHTEKSCSFWSTPSWQPISQRSQDWISQGWRNKDWKAQEWQFEVKPSLDWESQELLERESLRQRALYQQIQPHTTIVHHTPDHQLQNFIFQVGLCQGSRQQDSESGVLIEDVYEEDVQSRDREPEPDTCQKPTDQQSEDTRPDNYPVSCQSLVPYTYVNSLSNIASEQEVQNNTPCSGSSKDLNATSSSSYQRDQQQSEDSD
ncbi:Membrane-spanning 4-domains, subfamily A, member 14 [Apodemus speciosus]|uniref:Membrane-spanning 4-domains, subfamily A, member 14 n=1 Tax=Apodemus speciosus TaxID=105296 RepID=A0ABQ0FSK8_APOSI